MASRVPTASIMTTIVVHKDVDLRTLVVRCHHDLPDGQSRQASPTEGHNLAVAERTTLEENMGSMQDPGTLQVVATSFRTPHLREQKMTGSVNRGRVIRQKGADQYLEGFVLEAYVS